MSNFWSNVPGRAISCLLSTSLRVSGLIFLRQTVSATMLFRVLLASVVTILSLSFAYWAEQGPLVSIFHVTKIFVLFFPRVLFLRFSLQLDEVSRFLQIISV